MRTPCATYLALQEPSGKSVARSALLRISEAITGHRSMDAIDWNTVDYVDAQRLRSSLTAKYAPATVNATLSAWRCLTREAWRLGLISVSDRERLCSIQGVRGSKLQSGRLVPDQEIKALFGAISVYDWDKSLWFDVVKRNAALLALAVGCGLRRAELVSLTADGYDAQAGTLLVHGKGSRERMAHLTKSTQAHLDAWLESAGITTGYLFPGTRSADHLAPTVFRSVLLRLCEAAGVPPCTPHDLRRSYATKLLLSGVDVLQVQRLMGHSSANTTAIYDHRPADVLHEAATRLELVPC